MSREIKFRAWDKKQKKMFYGVSTGTIKVWDENAPLLSHEFGYSEDCIFEQYTGLKDKNSKEIYEGDVLKFCNDKELARIVWNIPHAEFHIKWLECGVSDSLSWHLHDHGGAEVIGTIHENPELLEVSNALPTI